MKLRIDHEAFLDAVRWGTRNVAVRPTVPVLAGAVLTASGDGLTVSCFDYETAARVTVDAAVKEPGTVVVPGRLLAEIARNLPGLPVDLSLEAGRVRLVCGGVRFGLPTMPVEDYPVPPDFPEAVGTVDAAAFARAVARTAVAAGRDDTLPVLTGVEIEATGPALALAATDRYRMALCDLDWSPAEADAHVKALVPARILAGLAKGLGTTGGEVTIGVARESNGAVTLVGFAGADRSTVSRVLDGRLPQLRALVDTNYPTHLRVDAAELTQAARRVSLVAERDTAVRLRVSGETLTVEAGSGGGAGGTGGSGGTAEGAEELRCAYEGIRDELSLAFKPGYLLDCLAVLDAPVAVFAVDGDVQRVLITGESGGAGEASGSGEAVDGYRHMLRTLRTVG